MSASPEKIFQQTAQLCEANPSLFQAFEGSYSFHLQQAQNQAPQVWFVRCGETPVVLPGAGRTADCTITLDQSIFLEIVAGTLLPALAFREGRLAIEGDTSSALKLHLVFSLIEQAVDTREVLLA